MKKIVSLLVFTVALVWSWTLIHSSTAIGFETHSGIQEKMSALITETLKAKKPDMKDMKITRLWTETVDDHKVRATFAYTFTETGANGELVEQHIEGHAVLHREPSDDPSQDRWILQDVKTTGDSMVFSEGTVVSPNATEDETDPTAPGATPPAAAEPPATK